MTEFSAVIQTITSSSAIIRLAGDMDTNSFERMEEEFNRALESGLLGVILDLTALDSITSSSLGAIINLSQTLEDRKGKLFVTVPKPNVLELVRMLGLAESLTIESLDKAKNMAASLRPA